MAYTKRPDAELLQAALAGYQHQRDVIAQKIAEIQRELGGKVGRPAAAGAAPKSGSAAGKKKKRNMSAEGRERIAEATRKRWEAYRAAKAAEK